MLSRTAIILVFGLLGCHSSAYRADDHYILAERHFQAGDFTQCEQECQKALDLNPNYRQAKALWLESQFLQGKGVAIHGPEGEVWLKKSLPIGMMQMLIEIEQAHHRGQRAFNLGEYGTAEREFRKVLEYTKWVPDSARMEARRQTALKMLEQTKEARRKSASDE